ncbi:MULTISPECIES: PA3371 family protein [Pseudomonas]|uniref:PA3371 family protein n=1 Tax=Pseudomonas TaxID=286 RepID=UPI000CFD4ACD|nr:MULTISPECIES: PA3371 family protein [Pseudomonas]PQZ84938.1 hypothetical protein CQ048_24505 [Pseudomonas trivialis]PRB20927.1 hypothetical protein CQ041_24370 [Pseudomonas sp. MYb60]
MSKSAWLFLCLTVVTTLAGLSATSPDAQTSAFVATGVTASLFLFTLIKGRRIKFDPVLR